ncbi:peptidoglycan-binding domain-containing protein [Spirulina subsalsa]|nr:peptidoglycan-binding domain-containing protein [Spirulina subsalsa]
MDTLSLSHVYACYEETEQIEYELETLNFFNWRHIPSAVWLGALATGVLATSVMVAAPAFALRVQTPNGSPLCARNQPSASGPCLTVSNGAPLLPVVARSGDWLQLSSGRWVYGPYTTAQAPQPPVGGGRARRVSTPNGGTLCARNQPSATGACTAVRNGAVLLPVVAQSGDWLQLSSGRWVYGPYTASVNGATSPGTGGVMLRMGSTGDAVRQVQTRLAVTIDGVYGSNTAAAVRRFQSQQGLLVDGIVGPQTRSALGL